MVVPFRVTSSGLHTVRDNTMQAVVGGGGENTKTLNANYTFYFLRYENSVPNFQLIFAKMTSSKIKMYNQTLK